MHRVLDFLRSLSLGTSAILVALASVSIVWLLCSKAPPRFRFLWAIAIPFALSYCLYWLPVYLGADPSEYHAWELIGVGAWFVAGFVPSIILVLYLRMRSRRLF
jgi:hypothetical protein